MGSLPFSQQPMGAEVPPCISCCYTCKGIKRTHEKRRSKGCHFLGGQGKGDRLTPGDIPGILISWGDGFSHLLWCPQEHSWPSPGRASLRVPESFQGPVERYTPPADFVTICVFL